MGATPHLLLVEDDDVDVMIAKRAFRREKLPNGVTVARNGLEALDMLRGTGGHTAVPRPYLILLDLNMPRMNGLEFLEALRKDPDHHTAVVFVLTTSDAEQDKLEAYRHHVAGYIVKRSSARSAEVAQLIQHYNTVVELPAA